MRISNQMKPSPSPTVIQLKKTLSPTASAFLLLCTDLLNKPTLTSIDMYVCKH